MYRRIACQAHNLTTLVITMAIGGGMPLVGALPLGMWSDERKGASFGLAALLMWVWAGWWASRGQLSKCPSSLGKCDPISGS